MSIGYNTERTLKDFLVAVGDGERQLESARQRLCQIRDFAPNSAFQRIDRNCSGNVSSREFGDFLRDQGVYHISDSELYQLTSFFDNNGNGSLSFQEFLQMWLPCEDNILRNMTLDRYSARVGRFDRLPADIERAVTAVIELEITLQRRLEGLKLDLGRNYDYNAYAAFAALDRNRNGSINSFEVGSFLRQNGHFASEMELVAIIRRIDCDGDATVSTSEFAAFMRPGAGGASAAPSSPPRGRASSANRTSGYTSPLKNTSPARGSSAARSGARGGSPVRGSPGPRLMPRAEDELISALKDLCNNEQDLENAKVSLSRERDFNLRDAFDIFDNNRSGRISTSELYSGLTSIGVMHLMMKLIFSSLDMTVPVT